MKMQTSKISLKSRFLLQIKKSWLQFHEKVCPKLHGPILFSRFWVDFGLSKFVLSNPTMFYIFLKKSCCDN